MNRYGICNLKWNNGIRGVFIVIINTLRFLHNKANYRIACRAVFK